MMREWWDAVTTRDHCALEDSKLVSLLVLIFMDILLLVLALIII